MGTKIHLSSFKRILSLTGFTPGETKILIFLLVVFLIGLSIRIFKNDPGKFPAEEYSYTAEDSIFAEAGLKFRRDSGGEILTEKKVDYHRETLDFSHNKNIRESELREKSVDLNKADKETLIKLPGIGEKTAEKILNYRRKIGSFVSVDQLMDVSGIGKIKLERIRKYLIVE